MLKLSGDVYCSVFRLEIALAMHFASVWGAIHRIPVSLTQLEDASDPHQRSHDWDLAVDFEVDGGTPDDRADLAAYLARNLSPKYAVVLKAEHVHVEWDRRRRGAELPAAALAEATAPT